ncbi:MAG: hypothetical protein WBD36_02340 [Bacteroidota bacterium]
MTRALFAFVDAGTVASHDQFDQPTLPTNAAIVFFEDKSLDNIKERLEAERDRNSVSQLTISTLATIIEKVRTGNEDAAIIPEPKPEHSGENGNADPRADMEESETTDPISEVSLAKDSGVPIGNGEEPSFETIQVPETVKSVASGSFDDVHVYFSKLERKRFIRSIFKRDEASFHKALEKVNALASWEEASHYLDSLFLAQEVDPFSKEAVSFTDRVYTRFHSSK